MFDGEHVKDWHGQDVVDPEGHQVGRLEEVYGDNYGGSAGFACVKTGLFGRRLSFVPLEGASRERDYVRVAYPADQIKHAPSVEPDGSLTAEEEAALFEFYGLDSSLDPQDPSAALDPEAEHWARDPQAQYSSFVPAQPPRLVRHHYPAQAADIADARETVAGDDLRRAGHPGLAGEGSAIDADRLSALEQRVADLENWRGR